MEGATALIILILFIILTWLAYHFGYRVLDAFSPVSNEYGLITQKEYIPPHSEIISRTVVRSSEGDGFAGATRYDIPAEIQVAEKCILHVQLNGRAITASVRSKVYDRVDEGDRVLVEYSKGRFSKRIYLRKIKRS